MSRVYINHLTSLFAVSLLAFLLISCDGGIGDFGDMNEDPTVAKDIEPENEFTTIQIGVTGSRFEMWRANLIYAGCIAQHVATPWWSGCNNAYNPGFSASLWTTRYAGGTNNSRWLATIKNVENLLRRLEEREGNHANRIAAARVMRVFTYHRVTDVYGDVPYSGGGQATEGILKPRFTPQDSIYEDMYNELTGALEQFDSSQPTYEEADLMYGGDVNQWKKFTNSLLLRLALRQVKVNPSRAQSWAQEAINGGVMTDTEDDAVILHQDGPSTGPAGFNTNGNSEVMDFFDGGAPWITDTFVRWLDNRNDPRLPVLAASNPSGDFVGLPPGVSVADSSGLPDALGSYSLVNSSFQDLGDPSFLQRYAEVEFMLAEAAVRWGIAPSSAETHYENGVRAAMNSLSKYGDGASISQSAIDQYVADNPFNSSGDMAAKLEQINEQYWAATFLNELEAWANWRRSGYPDFEPPEQEGVTDGEIIRRLAYPQNEQDVNTENWRDARTRQGIQQGNILSVRVWWDCGELADQCNTSGLGSDADPSN